MNNEIYGRLEVKIENDQGAQKKKQPGKNKLFAGYRGG